LYANDNRRVPARDSTKALTMIPRRLIALLALMVTCVTFAVVAGAQQPLPCEAVASIGTATMADDGVITLRIRSLPPGPIAEGVFRYAPSDPQYAEIMRHLGGIMPGETKPVRPWC
jgi:hypothetical protein